MPFHITIEVIADDAPVDVARFVKLAEEVMDGEELVDETEVTVLVTTDEEVRRLNLQFLGNDEPTDVLSFPDESDEFVEGGEMPPYLGDIAISLPTAIRQAQEIGHPLDDELAHLLVHGILHLCGYDHVNSPEEEAEMRAREEKYLGAAAHHH